MITVETLTPVPHTQCLFCPSVEHRAYNHETRRNGAFAHSKNKSHGKQASEVRARRMAAESDPPNEDVDAHPFSDREPLESQILWILEDKVAEIENSA